MPGVPGVSGVPDTPPSDSTPSELPADTPSTTDLDRLAADIEFVATARLVTLDPADPREAARQMLAEHPHLAGLGNVERLAAVTAILGSMG